MDNKIISITKEDTYGLKTFIEGYYKGRFFEAEYFYDSNSFIVYRNLSPEDKEYVAKSWLKSENIVYIHRKLLKIQ